MNDRLVYISLRWLVAHSLRLGNNDKEFIEDDKERRDLLRQLDRELNWPKG